LQIIFLGTGASHGIPVIGCDCEVCKSENPKDKRLRSSIFIKTKHNNLVIDTGPDFRQQMLREKKITVIDAVLLTHEHKDHTAGLDDVRAYNYLMRKAMSFYAEDRVLETIKREYAYVFSDDKYPGIPELDLHPILNRPFEINGEVILPIQVFHHMLPVFGFRINNMAYITDAKLISDTEKEKLKNLDVLVLNALRVKPHISHMGFDEILALIEELRPKKAYLTHISHMQYGYEELISKLPANVLPAYDGLIIEI
jgi:phosphoribosyl 1,2-cyclic phosphate phosphodiesterase